VTVGDPRRHLLLELLRAALEAVEGRRCTRAALAAYAARESARPVWVAAIGKAAAAMTLGAADVYGTALKRALVITKDGHLGPAVRALPGVELHESGHPVPDERSLHAGARLLAFTQEMPAEVRAVFLVSGGASSLVEVLPAGVDLAQLTQLNRVGLAAGVSIAELNARRIGLSLIKGGRLSARLRGRGALALFISDVPHDDPAVIGSGLLGPPPGGTLDDTERLIVASIEQAMHAVRTRAEGLSVHLAAERFAGDAVELARHCAAELRSRTAQVRVWGGESVLQLPPRPGHGGRNQHLALAAALCLEGQDLLLLAVGSDGTDGPTADAGGLVDGHTCERVRLAGLDPQECLAAADSARALAAAGDLVHTGPTDTNVGDLVIGLCLAEFEVQRWLEQQRARV
jgi:hydroxypyruvate reductase